LNYKKILRTVVLGTVFAVLAIYWLAEEFDLDRDMLLRYLGASVLFIAGCAVSAGVVVLITKFFRR